MKIKTIDIQAREWFDRINGNSYFSGQVTVNYGMPDEKSFDMPFQYGYGRQYIQEAFHILSEQVFTKQDNDHFNSVGYYGFCKDMGIALRYSKKENCKKKEL